jgi:Bacterial Ig-like domain
MKILKSKSARYTTSAVLISSLFAACGGGGGGGSPTAAPPAQQAPAATLVSTLPVNNATKVSARQEIVLTFSGPLDASTLIAGNVQVTGGGVTVPVSLSYDASTYKLTIRGQEPLSDGVQYTVTIPSVRDIAGNAIAASPLTFKTSLPQAPRTYAYSNGVIVAYTAAVVDTSDNITRLITYTGKGADLEFEKLPNDDLVSNYVDITYDAAGNASRFVTSSAGPDGRIGTVDDALVSTQVKTFDASGKVIRIVNSNNTGAISDFTTNAYNAAGYVTQTVNYTSVGKDGLIGGTDDDVGTYTNREYNTRNALTREITSSAGGDKRMSTADDVATVFSTRAYDAAGNQTERVLYSGPGPDGIALNGNDVLDYRAVSAYDANGNPTQTVFYDSLTATANANIRGYVRFTFGQFGLNLLEAFKGPGVGAWLDGNDEYSHYSRSIYDAGGSLLSRTTYIKPGANGTWNPLVTPNDDEIGEAGNFFGF